jgi:hypothetical protein
MKEDESSPKNESSSLAVDEELVDELGVLVECVAPGCETRAAAANAASAAAAETPIT